MVNVMYLELHTSSAFSFLEAASLPETLIAQAARYGYPAIALLDRDGVYGAPRFHRAATAAGIKAIIGAELTIDLPATSPFEPFECRFWLSLPKGIETSAG